MLIFTKGDKSCNSRVVVVDEPSFQPKFLNAVPTLKHAQKFFNGTEILDWLRNS